MKCPNCGKELKEGQMLCEECGGEINLVPEFETRVEERIAEGLRSILKNADITQELSYDVEKEIKIRKWVKALKYTGLGLIALACILTAVTFWNVTAFFPKAVSDFFYEDGNYEKALHYLEKAIERDTDNISYRFALADIYLAMEDTFGAVQTWQMIAENTAYDMEDRIEAAKLYITYLESLSDYGAISSYVAAMEEEALQAEFVEYLAEPVVFSQPEGTYSSLITLKLSSEGTGTIYYTTDETVPDEHSAVYENTIFLEPGENVISAIFINEQGTASDVVTKRYYIQTVEVSPPEVITYSGKFSYPLEIDILVNPGTSIYYTTDGTEPTIGSNRYNGNLYAPEGKSIFKFIAADGEGGMSETVTRRFEVALDAEITSTEAEEILIGYLEENGTPADENGRLLYSENEYLICEYLYPVTLSLEVDCYYFAVVARDTQTSEQYRTGIYYAVDYRTETVYAADEYGRQLMQ